MSGSLVMDDVTPIFRRAADMFNMDPLLPMAVAQVESGGTRDPDRAVSPAGALGRMQVMPANLERMNVRDPSDPEQNITAGTSMLDEALTAANGNVPLALRLYQGGPDQTKWGPQNAAYPAKVGAAYARLVAQRDQVMRSAAPPPAGAQQDATDAVDDFLAGRSDSAAPQPAQAAPMAVAAAPAMDHIDAFLSGGGSTQPAPAPVSAPKPFADGQGGELPDGSATRDPAVWARWMQEYQPAPTAPASPLAQPGMLASAASGFRQGMNDVANTIALPLNNLAAMADKQFPALAALDAWAGKDPAHQNELNDAERQAYEASPAGQSTAGGIGRFTGNMLASAPILGAGASVVRGLGGALARATPEAALAASSMFNNNLLARGLVTTGGNALTGAGFSVLTGGDPASGAVANAVGAPIVKFVSAPLARGAGRVVNLLAGEAAERTPAAGAIGSPVSPGAGWRELQAEAATPREPANPILNPGTGARPFDVQLNPAGEAAPAAGPNAPVTAAEMAAVPDALPRQITPLLGPADYEARADQIIKHFAKGGRTDVADAAILGSPKTLAQMTGNAGLATLERSVRGVAPNDFAMVDDGAKQVQQSLLGRITGTAGNYENAVAAREAATSKMRNTAFAGAKPVATQPILDQTDALIAKNAGRPTVQEPLRRFRDQVSAIGDGNDGEQAASPQSLYNARQYLSDMVSPRATGTANDGRAAAAQLLSLKPALDSAIEEGAPGFRAYLKAFEEHSGPINGMEYLQSRNLTDYAGNPQLGAIDKTLKDIGNKQTFGRGAQVADSITPNQVEALRALRDDLLQTRNSARGKALGSDTAMNFATNSTVNALTNPLARGAAKLGGAVGGGLGGYAAGEGANAVVAAAQRRAEEGVRSALVDRLLNRQGKGVAALQQAQQAPQNDLAAGVRPKPPAAGAFGSPVRNKLAGE